MISIYSFENYREFLATWLKSNGKRGISGQMAKTMRISSTMISLILKGEKNLSLEQAADLADFLGMSENETDYFFLLVEINRAGTEVLKQKLGKKRKAMQKEAQKISSRVKKDLELTEESKAIFYSNWMYSGIRILSAIPNFQSVSEIAKRIAVPLPIAAGMIDFLIQHGLCKMQNGKITFGPLSTHEDSDSPHVNKHHQNWRFKSMQSMESRQNSDLFFTSPMALSAETALEIRKQLPTFIEEVMKKVGPSESEKSYCLNIDWFEY
jgi:uncharacterized protein (TIGR02147 family)